MSVVAWDGSLLCTDNMGIIGNIKVRMNKTYGIDLGTTNETILAWVGIQEQGLMLVKWYENGAKAEDWPKFPDTRNCTLVVATKLVGVCVFEDLPIAQEITSYMAWGTGAEFAIGAMAHGANAYDAVVIACEHCVTCGYPSLQTKFRIML